MKDDAQRFLADLVSNERMQAAVKELGTDLGRIVAYSKSYGYLFTGDELDDLADHHDRALDPRVLGLRRQGWHLRPDL
jgi:hypothetical protein